MKLRYEMEASEFFIKEPSATVYPRLKEMGWFGHEKIVSTYDKKHQEFSV